MDGYFINCGKGNWDFLFSNCKKSRRDNIDKDFYYWTFSELIVIVVLIVDKDQHLENVVRGSTLTDILEEQEKIIVFLL